MAKRLLGLNQQQLNNILFTDEILIPLHAPVNRQNSRIYLHPEDPEEMQIANEIPQFDKKVMVWAGVTATGKIGPVFVPAGLKVSSRTFISEVLQPNVLPLFEPHPDSQLFSDPDLAMMLQDNAPAHRAKVTQQWLLRHEVPFFPAEEWAPESPDLNIQENVWAMLKSELEKMKQPRSVHQLKAQIRSAWQKVKQQHIKNCFSGYSSRLRTVVKNGGKRTSY
jgi:hypothetical protein